MSSYNMPDLGLLQKPQYSPEPILKPFADPTIQNFLYQFGIKIIVLNCLQSGKMCDDKFLS